MDRWILNLVFAFDGKGIERDVYVSCDTARIAAGVVTGIGFWAAASSCRERFEQGSFEKIQFQMILSKAGGFQRHACRASRENGLQRKLKRSFAAARLKF